MKRYYPVLLILVSLGLAGVCPAQVPSAALAGGLNEPDVIACIQLRGITATLEKVSGLVQQFGAPIDMGITKKAIGDMFGDPTFINLDGSATAVAVLFDPNKFSEPAIFVKAKDPEKIASFVRQKNLAAYSSGEYVIISRTQQNLARCGELVPSIRAMASAGTDWDISLSFDLARIAEVYKDRIDLGIAQFMSMIRTAQSMDATESFGIDILELEIQGYLNIAKQVKQLGITVKIEKDALIFANSVTAGEGTGLAKLLSPPGIVIEPEYDAFVPDNSFMSGVMAIQTNRFIAFLREEMTKITEKYPKHREMVIALLEASSPWASVEETRGAFAIINAPENPMTMLGVYKVSGGEIPGDPFSMIHEGIKAMAAIGSASQEMPIKPIIEDATREYQGAQIRKMFFRVNPSAFTPELFEQMKAIYDKMSMEIAVKAPYLVTASNDTLMNRTLDLIVDPGNPTEVPVVARKYFPEGGFYYGDMDLGGLMCMAFAFAPKNAPMPISSKMFEQVRKDPICMYAALGQASLQAGLRVPLGPITDVVTAFTKAMPAR